MTTRWDPWGVDVELRTWMDGGMRCFRIRGLGGNDLRCLLQLYQRQDRHQNQASHHAPSSWAACSVL